MASVSSPSGHVTRGTTNTNRLRRVDRWIARHPALRRAADPLVVDLGYGASGVTALELEARLRPHRPGVEVVGLEIDSERVTTARTQLARVQAGLTPFAADARVRFDRGGFEVPLPSGRRAAVIRAFNVLRQYDEGDVAAAWALMASRLAPGGLLVEGTCDELGRTSAWVAIDPAGMPCTFTASLRLSAPSGSPEPWRPSLVAARLPKALIHHNVDGERVHALLTDLDREWERAAGMSPFGAVQRWRAAVAALSDAGWPVLERGRWRLGEITLPWEAVAPAS